MPIPMATIRKNIIKAVRNMTNDELNNVIASKESLARFCYDTVLSPYGAATDFDMRWKDSNKTPAQVHADELRRQRAYQKKRYHSDSAFRAHKKTMRKQRAARRKVAYEAMKEEV